MEGGRGEEAFCCFEVARAQQKAQLVGWGAKLTREATQIVHSVKEGKKVRQQIIATLGRLDLLEASGQLAAALKAELPEVCADVTTKRYRDAA